MALKKMRFNTNKVNLGLDLVLALIFVAELETNFTGMSNHELFGLIFGGGLIVHFVLHWQWVRGITRQFFRKLLHESRLNYLLNIALLVDMVVLVVTGFLISRTLGFSFERENPSMAANWKQWHVYAADLALLIVAVHVGMHWKWIATYTKRYCLPHRQPARVVFAESAPSSAIQTN